MRAKSGVTLLPEFVLLSRAFIQLQEHRHTADYGNAVEWSNNEVAKVLEVASNAFDASGAIRTEDAAQDFLLDLFLPKRIR